MTSEGLFQMSGRVTRTEVRKDWVRQTDLKKKKKSWQTTHKVNKTHKPDSGLSRWIWTAAVHILCVSHPGHLAGPKKHTSWDFSNNLRGWQLWACLGKCKAGWRHQSCLCKGIGRSGIINGRVLLRGRRMGEVWDEKERSGSERLNVQILSQIPALPLMSCGVWESYLGSLCLDLLIC